MPPLKPVLDAAAERLREAGVPSPRHDAEVLAAHVLKVRRQGLWLVPEITPAALAAYQSLVADRAERIPLQHLTGVTGNASVTVRLPRSGGRVQVNGVSSGGDEISESRNYVRCSELPRPRPEPPAVSGGGEG